jgi:hypothetical protein
MKRKKRKKYRLKERDKRIEMKLKNVSRNE